jgi:hypothetical protein
MNLHLKDHFVAHETLYNILLSSAALIGLLASIGVTALVLRLAAGKW